MNSKPPRIFLSPPHMGNDELALIQEAFHSNYIAPLGPMVDAFEREFAAYTGIPHCLALSSGTAAMHLALRELGVGPGDNVIASSLTFIGSVSPATFLRANIIFIDADNDSWNLDPDLLAAELADCARNGKLPKVVIPTDLYGQCADLPRIQAICQPYGIPVVADSAEAMGARYQGYENTSQKSALLPSPSDLRSPPSGGSSVVSPAPLNSNIQPLTSDYRHSGFGARAAVFSFNGNKIITTSGGGMLASDDKALIDHARKLSQQAREPAAHYEHTEIGYNYRLSNVLAAIGIGQLRVLDERVAAKRRIFEKYRQLLAGLPGLEFMPEAPHGRSNRWLTVVLVDPVRFGVTNEQIRLALEAENIESRPVWKPMHLQPVFRGCGSRGGAVGERLFRTGLCLPSGTAMRDADLERVASIIRRCHQ